MIIVLPACRREIAALPVEIREDLADAVARLDAGLLLSMPLPRPMPSLVEGRTNSGSGIVPAPIAWSTRYGVVGVSTSSMPSRRRVG